MVAAFWLTSASLRRQFEVQAFTDPLPDLLNHRAFGLAAQSLICKARRTSPPLSGIVFDLDHFKGSVEGNL